MPTKKKLQSLTVTCADSVNVTHPLILHIHSGYVSRWKFTENKLIFFFLAADEESGVSLLKEQLHNVTVRFFFFYFPLDQGSLCLAGGGR